jgi:pimeloyl-ACP methyl ester carboxylesterase
MVWASFGRAIDDLSVQLRPGVRRAIPHAQMAAFVEWEQFSDERVAHFKSIHHPTLVMNGIYDEVIPVGNSYRLSENVPSAVLRTYPDSGHGYLFQFHEYFTRQAAAFLESESTFAPY